MDKSLTLAEMVSYEMPKTFKDSIPKFGSLSNSWKMKHHIPHQLLDSPKSISPLKFSYQDTSRERQKDFLRRSGYIKRNTKQSTSLNRILRSIPSIYKNVNRSIHCYKKRSDARLIDSYRKPNNCGFSMKSEKMFLSSSVTPGKHIGNLLAKIK